MNKKERKGLLENMKKSIPKVESEDDEREFLPIPLKVTTDSGGY